MQADVSGAAAGALQDALVRDWNPVVVALSVVIAVAASYAALDLVARVSATRGSIRSAWLVGGSVALGVGIWSMHFVGMLALDLRLPGGATVPMTYDMALMLLSFLVALGASLDCRGEAQAFGGELGSFEPVPGFNGPVPYPWLESVEGVALPLKTSAATSRRSTT